jgi:hypothetical protein
MCVNALTYKNNPNLLKRYLELNSIKGIFLAKDPDGGWQVFEGDEEYIGLRLANFQYKRDAVSAIKEWVELTKLPRFPDFK